MKYSIEKTTNQYSSALRTAFLGTPDLPPSVLSHAPQVTRRSLDAAKTKTNIMTNSWGALRHSMAITVLTEETSSSGATRNFTGLALDKWYIRTFGSSRI